jgi:uncharacterized protein (TIGR03084 family)
VTGQGLGEAIGLDDVVGHLDAQQRELLDIISGLDRAGLEKPSRCAGWNVADVLLHLAQTNEAALSSVSGNWEDTMVSWTEGMDDTTEVGDVNDLAGHMVDRDRPDDPNESRKRWLATANAQVEAFASTDPHARVPWVAGDMAARTLAATRLSETWIHTNDISVPLDLVSDAGDRLWPIARLVWRTVPYAFVRAGLEPPDDVAFVLTSAGGETWEFGDPGSAANVVRGPAFELCEVAGQRRDATHSTLTATGPQADGILSHMRTFA